MNKTALITGTTSGIGYDLCDEIAKRKINLVLVSRNEEKLKLQKEGLIKKYNINVDYIVRDLEIENSALFIVNELDKKNIEIDYLINNAGFNEAGEFIKTSLNKEVEMINLHIIFTTELTKYLLEKMLNNNYGRILNIASTGSYIPCPNNIVYTSTKAYVMSFSKGLSAELVNTNVSVSAVAPGATKTNFAKNAKLDNTLLFKTMVMDSKKVAKISINTMMRGKTVKIIGIYNKLLVFFSLILPKRLINFISKKMIS